MENQQILANIAADKDIQKAAKKMQYPLTNEQFLDHANAYLNAIRQGRMCCIIKKVSQSGMTRQIKFNSCEPNANRGGFWWRQYIALFKMFGYTEARGHNGSFIISGCGMDMVFHTNYTIVHKLHRLGIIEKEECDALAQQTPTIL